MHEDTVAKEVLRLRLSQMIVNEKYKAGLFKIPIHIAMGHEAIAVAVDAAMGEDDVLACTHRNMHYNLARAKALKPILDEYLLSEEGLAAAQLGSMNLANPKRQLLYTSSILGNDLPVATGLALAQKVKKNAGVTFVVTGDGAMEEGTFYESLLFMKSNSLAAIIIVENNEWSMHTKIEERRSPIDLSAFAGSLGVGYEQFKGNDTYEYLQHLKELRQQAIERATPIVVEVVLQTLGGWYVKNPDDTERFIHAHAGPVPKIALGEWPELEHSVNDPVFVLRKRFPEEELRTMARDTLAAIKAEIREL